MTSQKYARLIDEAGQGPALVILRNAGSASKSVAVLATDFRVLSFAVDPKAGAADAVRDLGAALAERNVAEAGIIADAAAAPAAIAFAVAQPELAQSVALLSPSGSVGDVTNLKAPVMAMFGTSDTTRAPDAAKTFCQSIPNCRLVYVYDAGRAMDDERPEAVSAALQDFAVRREGYLVNAKRGNLYP
jgi:pimeloyl-ACP methyl ester carboxylesterase